MARRPRVHFPGALYHVISRGNQRKKIYKDDPDYQRFETLLGEVIKRHALTLYAYVLMPNHFHLLLEVGRVPLSKAMQVLLYRYTRRYNQRYRKSGHLFQGRYKGILCDRNQFNGGSEISGTGFEHDVVGGQAIGGGDCNGQRSADGDGAALHPASAGTKT